MKFAHLFVFLLLTTIIQLNDAARSANCASIAKRIDKGFRQFFLMDSESELPLTKKDLISHCRYVDRQKFGLNQNYFYFTLFQKIGSLYILVEFFENYRLYILFEALVRSNPVFRSSLGHIVHHPWPRWECCNYFAIRNLRLNPFGNIKLAEQFLMKFALPILNRCAIIHSRLITKFLNCSQERCKGVERTEKLQGSV